MMSTAPQQECRRGGSSSCCCHHRGGGHSVSLFKIVNALSLEREERGVLGWIGGTIMSDVL